MTKIPLRDRKLIFKSRRKNKLIKRWITAFSVGYILVFFSEFLFVNLYDGFEIRGLIQMFLVYSMEAYLLLAIMDHFRVRTPAALFLAGAAYGWLLEGVVVQTMYDIFPFQVAFTGLSWHALIDVLVGVVLMRYVMQHKSVVHTALLAAVIGLFWGFWAISWKYEGMELLSPLEFAKFAFAATLPLIMAYLGWNRTPDFSPNKYEVLIFSLLHCIGFAFVVSMIPFAVLVLPPLLGLIWLALRNHRKSITPGTLRVYSEKKVSPRHYPALLVMPVFAGGVYALLLEVELFAPPNTIIALITVPIGICLFFGSLWNLRKPIRGEAVPADQ